MTIRGKGGVWLTMAVMCGLLVGCVTENRPSLTDIRASRVKSLDGTTIDSRKVTDSIFLVITTSRAIRWKSVGESGSEWYPALQDALEHRDPLRSSIGLAFAVDRDGYLITAAHCLIPGSYTYLLGKLNGKAVVFEPRVVAKLTGEQPGTECALLAVSRPLDAWLKHGPLPHPDEAVVAVSWLVDPVGANFERGSVVNVTEYEDGPRMSLIETTLPLWHGDSGAPLLDVNGEVVGVNVGGYRGLRVGGKVFTGRSWHGQGLACAPRWDDIERRIRDDAPARKRDIEDRATQVDGPDMDAANVLLLRMSPGGGRR